MFSSRKIWEPPRHHFGFFKDQRNFGSPPKFGKFFETGARTYSVLLNFITYTITYSVYVLASLFLACCYFQFERIIHPHLSTFKCNQCISGHSFFVLYLKLTSANQCEALWSSRYMNWKDCFAIKAIFKPRAEMAITSVIFRK